MSRKSNTEARRAQIVAALLSVLASHGYAKATVQAIAREAGLTPGLLHYHFASKHDILMALVQTVANFGQARYQDALADADTPQAQLHAYLQARLGLGHGADAQVVRAWVMIGAEAVRQDDVRELYQSTLATELRVLRNLLRRSLQADGRSTQNVAKLAAAVLALVEGAFQLSSAAAEVMPRGYAVDTTWLLVQRFIAAEPQAASPARKRVAKASVQ